MPDFFGTTGNDILTGTADDDYIEGRGGADTIDAGDGNDTVVLTAQLGNFGTINGGAGIDTLRIDRMVTPASAMGPYGPYLLDLAPLSQTATTVISGFERLAFNSQVGDVMNVALLFGGAAGQINQIGPGLSANAELIGGGGLDTLSLSYNASVAGGVVTAPSFTYSNWQTSARAYYAGDRVQISITGAFGATLSGSAHTGIQSLFGGAGSDTINGSDDMDLISGGAGGSDFLYGNGGDDTLLVVNSYFITLGSGAIGAETTRTGAGTLFDGGSGFDFLLLGGNVNFQGTLTNIEGLSLAPGYVNPNNSGGSISFGSQYATRATFSGATFATLPSNLLVDGQGSVVINLADTGVTFDGSAIQFDVGADVTFEIVSGAGNDTVTGTTGTDVLYAQGGSDTLNGLGGDDTLWLSNAAASAQGGDGDDAFILMANGGGSNIAGGAGHDVLVVQQNLTPTYNILTGTLSGIEEVLLTGTALVMSGTQFANGLAADGSISGSGALVVVMDAGVNFSASGLTMNTSNVVFNVIGSTATDIIKANANAINIINGGDSNDQIRGGKLGDNITGGNGNDKIIGWLGADTLTGGAGVDQFRYVTAADSGPGAAADHITDFVSGTDKLNFTAIDANPGTPAIDPLTYIGNTAFHATGAAEVRWGDSGVNLVVQVDLDGNGTVDMEIVLDNLAGQALTSGDFML
jgi:Ca2+-binding RTX toxin-like protein